MPFLEALKLALSAIVGQPMQNSPLEKLILGIFCTISGVLLIVFHKQIKERRDRWNERVPWFLQSGVPGGPILTVILMVFGVLFIYVGIAQLFSLFFLPVQN